MSKRAEKKQRAEDELHEEDDDDDDDSKAIAAKRSANRRNNGLTPIPDLLTRIFPQSSSAIAASLKCPYNIPDSLDLWGQDQALRNVSRVSGQRTVEEALSEFKLIKNNEYFPGVCSNVEKTTNTEDACACKKQCDFQCLNRSLQLECNPEFCPVTLMQQGQPCGNQRISRGEIKRVQIRVVPEKGVGLFASEDIASGQYVNEYVGEVVDERECLRRLDQDYALEKHKYLMRMDASLIIDATRKGNLSRFINHSCEPNCKVQEWKVRGERRMGIFSTRAIKSGEELSFNYNFQHYGEGIQQCSCGAPTCIGLLGPDKQANNNSDKTSNRKPVGKICSLFPKNFLVQVDSRPKVEGFLLDLLEAGLSDHDTEYAQREAVFLVRNVRNALQEYTSE